MTERKKIGELWIKEVIKNGSKRQYMSGVLDLGVSGEIPILVFKAEKTQDDSPDFTIMHGVDVLSGLQQVHAQRQSGDEYN